MRNGTLWVSTGEEEERDTRKRDTGKRDTGKRDTRRRDKWKRDIEKRDTRKMDTQKRDTGQKDTGKTATGKRERRWWQALRGRQADARTGGPEPSQMHKGDIKKLEVGGCNPIKRPLTSLHLDFADPGCCAVALRWPGKAQRIQSVHSSMVEWEALQCVHNLAIVRYFKVPTLR